MCHQHKTLYAACGCTRNICAQPTRCEDYRRGRCTTISRDVVAESDERVCKECITQLRGAIRRLFQLVEKDVLRMANEVHRKQVAEQRAWESAVV